MSFGNIKAGIVTFYGVPKDYTKNFTSTDNKNSQPAGKIRDTFSPFSNINITTETADSFSLTGR